MKEIRINPEKGLKLLVAIVTLGVGIFCISLPALMEIELRVFGADLDRYTSSILVVVIGLMVLPVSIDFFIQALSVGKVNPYALIMDNSYIRYPSRKIFRGYYFGGYPKDKVVNVTTSKNKNGRVQIFLILRDNRQALIPEFSYTGKLKPHEVADVILDWIKS